jgi:6-phosphogluconolactonase
VVHLRGEDLLTDRAALRVALSARASSPAWDAARTLLEHGGDAGVTATWNEFVARFVHAANGAIAARGTFSCALTGGSAVKMYAQLARAPLDWPRVEFFLSDERLVPLESPDSNYRAAREALPLAKLHPVRVALDPADAAADYAEQLPEVLDLVFLGMGPDGHVASLFPGHPLLNDHVSRVAAVVDSPKPPARRVTLTLRALAEAREVWFLVPGESKKPVAHVARADRSSMLPAALVQRAARSTTWFLDP